MVLAVNARSLAFGAALALFALGCEELDDYRGRFQGNIVEGGFVRDCFGPEVTATLVFDPRLAIAPLPPELKDSEKNRLTTSDGTFKNTILEPIEALPHDQLSKLDFPGSQRLRNFLLFARPEQGPLAGRDALVVVSLLEDKRVELRVIARSEPGAGGCASDENGSDAGTSEGPRVHQYFGLFRLRGK